MEKNPILIGCKKNLKHFEEHINAFIKSISKNISSATYCRGNKNKKVCDIYVCLCECMYM